MRYFYGWTILALMLTVTLFKSPGQANVMGVITPHLLRDLDLDSSSFGTIFAGATLAAATVQPSFGHCFDRFGARVCLPCGLLLLATGLLVLSAAEGPGFLCGACFLMRTTSIGCLQSWPSALIALWFDRRRGRALAAMMVVAGLPTGMMADFVHISDEALGWRHTYALLAVCSTVLALLCALLVRHRPADVGQYLDGAAPPTDLTVTPAMLDPDREGDVTVNAGEAETGLAAMGGLPPRSASTYRATAWLRGCSRTLALLYASVFVQTTIGGGIDIFTASIAHEHGSNTDVALTVFMPMGLVLSLFSIITGVMLDRGVKPHAVLSAACLLAGLAACLATQLSSAAGALTYAVTRGAAHGLYFPALTYAMPYYFGVERIGLLLGGQAFMVVSVSGLKRP